MSFYLFIEYSECNIFEESHYMSFIIKHDFLLNDIDQKSFLFPLFLDLWLSFVIQEFDVRDEISKVVFIEDFIDLATFKLGDAIV